MNKYEANVKINPIDDIKHILEDELDCYSTEVEIMKAGGTYDTFINLVYETIDWSNLFNRMTQMENDTIAEAIDTMMHIGNEEEEEF